MSRFTIAAHAVVVSLSGHSLALGGDSVPVGSVGAWLKSFPNVPALPEGWVECNGQLLDDPISPLNGQTIPDLNGGSRFLRGAASSGTAGGNMTHTHSGNTGVMDSGGSQGNGSGLGTLRHTHAFTAPAIEHLPPYYEVVWIMKVRTAPAGNVPVVSATGLVVMTLLVLTAGTVVLKRRRRSAREPTG